MVPGELSDLNLLNTNFGACLWRASQFVVLIFKSIIDSLTKLNVLTGGETERWELGP